jgi:hypothetical protein
MALPANWFFGGRNPLEGVLSPFGGFNLGNIQPVGPFNAPPSTVSTPTAGVSGTPAGQPSGGMDAMRTPFSQPTDAGAADGSGPGASPSGPGFSVGEAASTAGRGGSFGFSTPIGNVGPSTPGLVSSLSGLLGGPTLASLGMGALGPAGAIFGLGNTATNIAAHNMADPASNTPVADISPNAPVGPVFAGSEGFAGTAAPATGLPSTAIGRAIAAIIDSNPPTGSMGGFGFGSNGSTIDANGAISNSVGARTGQSLSNTIPEVPDANTTQIPDVPSPTAPTPTSDDASPVGNPGGIGPGGIGDGSPGTGDGSGVGAGPAGTGAGGASGVGGDGGVGTGPGDKRGGRVGQERQRPDPRRLSEMLKRGATVTTGTKRPGADDVPVNLSRGEEVVNKKATDRWGPELAKMNAWGNRQTGGFAVGQHRDYRR